MKFQIPVILDPIAGLEFWQCTSGMHYIQHAQLRVSFKSGSYDQYVNIFIDTIIPRNIVI